MTDYTAIYVYSSGNTTAVRINLVMMHVLFFNVKYPIHTYVCVFIHVGMTEKLTK